MDLALTFHVGLCIRIPRSERPSLSSIPAEPFGECFRMLQEASEALSHADEVADYQAIGVRCREALLAFSTVVQAMLPSPEDALKQAELKPWMTYFCEVALRGESQKARRQLLKAVVESAWDYTNWLTHTKSSTWLTQNRPLLRPKPRSSSLCPPQSASIAAFRSSARLAGHTASHRSARTTPTILPSSANERAAINVTGKGSRC